jgi:hypothetical protein
MSPAPPPESDRSRRDSELAGQIERAGNGREAAELELTRSLDLERDRPLDVDATADPAFADELADEDGEVYFLDAAEEWALLLPLGAILHVHGSAVSEEEAEPLFYECEAIEQPGQPARIQCTACGAGISETAIEVMIDALVEADDGP